MEDNIIFFGVAVALGAVLLAAVVWNYVRAVPQKRAATGTALCVFGFALVSSPLWARIGIKGSGWELSLVRACEEQAKSAVGLLEACQAKVPPEQAAAVKPLVERARISVRNIRDERVHPEHIRDVRRALDAVSAAVRASPPP